MRTTAILVLVTLVFSWGSAGVHADSKTETIRTLTWRLDQLQLRLDSITARQKLAQDATLDTLRRELSSLRALATRLSPQPTVDSYRDSLYQQLCNEIDLLKLDNQWLRAAAAANRNSFVSVEESGFRTGEDGAAQPAGTPSGKVTLPSLDSTSTDHSLRYSGYVDASGQFDNNSRRTDFNLNQVQVDLEQNVSDRASFRADVEMVANGPEDYSMLLEQGYVTIAPTRSKAWHLSFGRFNSPIGVEREDPNDTYLYTRGFLFDYALPSNLTGFSSSLKLGQQFNWTLLAVNGWDINADNNSAKTFGSRLGFTPSGLVNIGLSVLSGPELDHNNQAIRTLLDLDATISREESWNLSLELHRGQETHNPDIEGTARWDGALLVGHTHLGERFCLTARADYFNDLSGSRTGTPQELKALAVSPAMSVVDGLDLIWELRQTWSNRNSFGSEGAAASSEFTSALELTFSF